MKEKRGAVKKVKKLVVGMLLLCAGAALLTVLWMGYRIYHVPSDKQRREDIAALCEGDYEEAVLSMYTTEAFDAESFEHFCGTETVQADHAFVNLADIGDYLERSLSAAPNLTNIYIGLDPFVISGLYGYHASLYARDYDKYLTKYVEEYPHVRFSILLPAYSADYMRGLSEKKYTELVNAYRNLVNLYAAFENTAVFFAGDEEWLIKNPGNYDSPAECTLSIQETIIAYTLGGDQYLLTSGNMEERFGRMTQLVKNTTEEWPDFSQLCILFFGDSVLQYNAGSRSIPGVVEGLTGAQVYNCSQGGIAASESPQSELSFNKMVTRFLEQDTSGLEKSDNFIQGLTEYMQENHENKKYCFVINFGLNDYFGAHPVDNTEDPCDTETYAGALRTGLRTLKENFPEAEILVITPTYTMLFSEGTEKQGPKGGVLTDYVDLTVSVAEEMDVRCINYYADSGIDGSNWPEYLIDGCHPNETGALLLGENMIREMERMIAE